ncbi:MAG TPA: hypothetical protein VMH30_02510 [Verrucomicrobiae bacterium]|nr:hypothetical protein [Verrucomicrobiae bacterium]
MKFYSVAVMPAFLLIAMAAGAQTTAFTYQGQLSATNAPANGLYDFQFQLVDANSNSVTAPLTNAPVAVTNGFFTTVLNFGAAVFDGSGRWLEVGVRPYGNTNAYTVLWPLQAITSAPYSIRALAATSATNAMFLTVPLQTTNLSGIVSVTNLPPNVALLNSNETFSGAVTVTNPANIFAGNGLGLASLNPTNLAGIIPDAHLSANVALQSDAVLNFAGSVGATNFIGAGHGLTNVPGAFFWVTVSGSSAQANPNVGYICTNNVTPVTITLPASPGVGDTYKVAGVGDAGWIVAQNASQQIFAGNLSGSVGQSWTASGPGTADWTAVACSADGTKIAAASSGGYIYTSTNSGSTWTNQSGNSGAAYWSALASSADGTHLIAAAGYSPYASQSGDLYVSSNSGVTWTAETVPGSAAWSCVACSADGTKMAAVNHDGYIYTNYGSAWGAVNGTSDYEWNAIAMSSDGTKLVAAGGSGVVVISTNSGVNWLETTNLGSSANPDAVACSSDGSRMVVVTGSGGQIYLSTDFGAIWVQQNSTVSGDLTAVASSADGSRLATTVGGIGPAGSIYGSVNSGGTWSQLAGTPMLSWSSIASSADGSVLAAAAYGGNIYVSSQNSTTTGTAGYLSGAQQSVIELLYVGNGQFLPLSSEGTIRPH